jgi:hypothetical protein
MHRSECQFHFGLHTGGVQYAAFRGPLGQVLQQQRHTGFARDHRSSALAGANRFHELVQRAAPGVAAVSLITHPSKSGTRLHMQGSCAHLTVAGLLLERCQ